ncbi:MAG: peptidase M48 [Hyphomicrobium sp.]|nr:MAG: peptidase M48 [Hyphomicrobium sp.]
MPSSVSNKPHSEGHYARYSDGKTAGARDANVALTSRGIEITLDDAYGNFVWPYASLAAGEPLRDHAVDVLLSSREVPGASLFVPGQSFAAELKHHAPHLTARAERWRNARPWLGVTSLIVGFFALIYAAGWSPIRTIALTLPDSWRDRLGEQAILSMTDGYKKCSAPDGVAALKVLTERLSKVSGTGRTFDVVVYDWSLMNAFAVPGDQIVITKGLIEKSQSADEIAGVLAHEMGHGIELHPETGIIRAIGLATAVELMMGGSSGTLANFGVILAQLGYTRSAERKADLQAIRVLREAEISPKGLGDFFKRVADIEGEREGPTSRMRGFDILRTHPPTAERSELVRRQSAYPSTPALDASSWRDLKAICSVTTETPKPDKRETKPTEL